MRRKMQIAISYLCLTLLTTAAMMWVHSYRLHIAAVIDDSLDSRWYLSSWEGRTTIIRSRNRSVQSSRTDLFVTPATEFRAQRSYPVKGGNGPLLNPAATIDFASFEGVWADGIFKSMWGMHFPIWLPCIFFACFAVASRPRPRYRCSLFELFTLTTITAIIIAGISTLLQAAK